MQQMVAFFFFFLHATKEECTNELKFSLRADAHLLILSDD